VKLHRTVLLLSAGAALACKGTAATPRQRPPPAVTSAAVSVRDIPVEIRSPVDLRPLEQADVGAKSIGYLDAVLVDRGDRVRRGQLLAVVRPSDLPDQLAAARGTLAQLQAQATLARANRDRGMQLAPSGFVSQQDLQQQQSAVEGAEAALASAQSNVGVLAVRLGETRINSPLDGYVSVRRLDPGALVGPSSGTSSILTIQRLDVVRVFVPVNERDVAQLRVGQDAHVELDAVPGQSFQGKVFRISPSFDPAARTLDAEVQLPNPSGLLRPGMYGRASITTDIHRGALVLPASAIQISNDQSYVFVLDRTADPPGDAPGPKAQPGEARRAGAAGAGEKAARDGAGQAVPARVRRVKVQTGVDGGDWLEVTAGLKPGDEIVTAGMDVLSDGVQVRAFPNVDAFTGKPLATAAHAEVPQAQ
jgi:membrane fusion protein, multidrug efflux system